jgi:hypothetical protein
MLIIPALRRLRREDGVHSETGSQKNKKTKKKCKKTTSFILALIAC